MNEKSESYEDYLIGEGDDWIEPNMLNSPLDGAATVCKSALEELDAHGLAEEAWPMVTRGIPELAGNDSPHELTQMTGCNALLELFGAEISSSEWGGDVPGLSGHWMQVYAKPEEFDAMVAGIQKLADQIEEWLVTNNKTD